MILTDLESELRSESQRTCKLEEERFRKPRFEQPSILRLERERFSATNRPNASLKYMH